MHTFAIEFVCFNLRDFESNDLTFSGCRRSLFVNSDVDLGAPASSNLLSWLHPCCLRCAWERWSKNALLLLAHRSLSHLFYARLHLLNDHFWAEWGALSEPGVPGDIRRRHPILGSLLQHEHNETLEAFAEEILWFILTLNLPESTVLVVHEELVDPVGG